MQGLTDETESAETQCDDIGKRTRKLSFKGVIMTIEKLQKERNASFKEASKLKAQITTLLASKENVSVVQQHLKQFKSLCQNATDLHNSLFTEFPLPKEEQRKQETWFNFKKAGSDVYFDEISTWLKENGALHDDGENENDGVDVDENAKDDGDVNLKPGYQDEINPEDSVSNLSSKRSSKRSFSQQVIWF